MLDAFRCASGSPCVTALACAPVTTTMSTRSVATAWQWSPTGTTGSHNGGLAVYGASAHIHCTTGTRYGLTRDGVGGIRDRCSSTRRCQCANRPGSRHNAYAANSCTAYRWSKNLPECEGLACGVRVA